MRKEIYAALQIADDEIRLLVSEHHNARIHILKVEHVAHSGIVDSKVVDQASIVSAIKKALNNIEKNVNIKVSRVILVIPSINLQRVNRSIHSDVNDPLGRITKENIQEIYRLSYNQKPIENYELVNASVYRYRVNGFYVSKTPINEKAGRLFADVDLYYVNRNSVYQLATIVEQSGLEILDVCLDGIGVGKEASLLDASNDNYIVSLQIEAQSITLGLFYRGRLMHCEVLDVSIQKWIENVASKLAIPYELAARFVINNVDLNAQSYGQSPIGSWKHDNQQYVCSQSDIMNILHHDIQLFYNEIKSACQEIIATDKSKFVVVGKYGSLYGIDKALAKELNVEVETYTPNTLGVRDTSYVSLLGAFFNHLDSRTWQNYQKESVDFDITNFENNRLTKNQEGNLTNKLKSILKGKDYE